MISRMKKLLFFFSMAVAITASAYNVSVSGTAGYGIITVNDAPVASSVNVSGIASIGFVSTNSLYECKGFTVNGANWYGVLPYLVNISYDLNVAPIVEKKPPSGYIIPQNVMAISADCPDSGWGKIIFNSPTETNFVDDGKTYLFPSPITCLTIKAVGGDIEVNTTTNATQTISTAGQDASVPISPVVIEEGNSLVINLPIGELYFKGSGKVNILGAIYE